jgi:YHS domain-containing protein
MGGIRRMGLRRRKGASVAVAILAALLAGAPPLAADENLFDASHGHHLVADPRSGLAIFGYDPVSYHLDHKAVPGSPDHELALEGATWRFTSEANKAAFAEAPAVYLPLFGGHDAANVADGRMTWGDPEIFALVGGRLVLFRDAAARDRYATEAELRSRALRRWPDVVRLHAGH